MVGWRGFLLSVSLFVVLLASACGGGSSTVSPNPNPNPGDNQIPTGQWTGTAASSAAVNLEITGVPEIPFDSFDHGVSETAQLELTGDAYLQKYHAEVDGTSLVLQAPADVPVGEFPISYGIYKFAGLNDKDPQWLNIECLPAVFGNEYFVGIADYTERDWRWFGPVTFPEFQLDMRDLNHHVISELGNMYVIVLCKDGSGATLSRLVLTVEERGGEDPPPGHLPGAPHHLMATDGEYEDKVVIEWEPGIDADEYQLWRKFGEDGEWDDLAIVEGTRYEDREVEPGHLYFYKAFSVNEFGVSAHSNIDEGYAGTLGEHPLPAPFEIWASDGLHPDHVVVEWGYEGDYGYFEVWRRLYEGGEFAYLASVDGEHFRYEDYDVDPGVVYKYKVRAILGEREGPFSDYDPGHAGEQGGGGLPAPHEIWASDGLHPDRVVVEWGYEGDYTHFELWRRLYEGGEFAYLASVDGEHFRYEDYDVEPGTIYKYKVRAMAGEVAGPFSDYDPGHAEGSGGELPAPHEIWASDGAHPDHVVVEWGYEGDYNYFEIWRRPEAEGEFQHLDSLDGEHFRYEDYDVVPGTVYKYKVRAVLGEVEGPFSGYDTGYAEGGGGELPTPHEIWASDGLHPDHVVVEWGCEEGGYGFFELWRRPADGGEFTLLEVLHAEHNRYEDYDVEPGTVYKYKVRVRVAHEGELYGPFSGYDTGYAERGGEVLPAPFELQATKGEYFDKIEVWWGYGEHDYGYFEVWRKQDGEGHEWDMIGHSEVLEYVDDDLPGDFTFIYKVRARLEELASEFSNTDFGYLADNPEECTIEVILHNSEEQPWPGIPVVLYGLEEPVVHETGENGITTFEGIPRGKYLVVPMHREIAFDPVWRFVDLREGDAYREIGFLGSVDEMEAHRLRGVVYAFAGAEGVDRFMPIGGAIVTITNVATEEVWYAETSEVGYWSKPELPTGTYTVTVAKEGHTFAPELHDPVIDGMHLPERCDFRCYPAEH